MGKKNKKFKQRNKQIIATPTPSASPTMSAMDQQASEIATKMLREDLANAQLERDKALGEKYAFVRHDVRKLLWTLAILFVIMLGFFYLNEKTSTLNTFGNRIYKIGRFSI